MKYKSPSMFLAAAGWISVLALVWMLILRLIHLDWLSAGLLIFLFIIALISSAVASEPRNARLKPSDVEINIAGQVFDEKDFALHHLADGKVYIYLVLTPKEKKTVPLQPVFDNPVKTRRP